MSYERERIVALEAVMKAGRLCRAVQAASPRLEHLAKVDASPVTVADYASQIAVISSLTRAFPQYPIMGEEDSEELAKAESEGILARVVELLKVTGWELSADQVLRLLDLAGHPGGGTGPYWTLDPLDGTKGFLRGEQYAVALALLDAGEVVLGVLGCPNLHPWRGRGKGRGRIFIAVRGEGAFERGWDNDATEWRLSVSEADDFAEVVVCESVESGHSSHGDAEEVTRRLGVKAPPLRMDSQCKYGLVARGEASIYLRLPTGKPGAYAEKVWDHAAGSLVVTESGGRVSDAHGRPLDFSRGRTLDANVGIVASNARLHQRVVEMVQNVRNAKS